MISIVKVVRNPKGKEWEDTISIYVSGYSTTTPVEALMQDVTPGRTVYDHEVLVVKSQIVQLDASLNEVPSGGTEHLKLFVREVPYVIGTFQLYVRQDGVTSDPWAELYEPEQRDNDGVRFSTTLTINNNKNKLPLYYMNQSKGGLHTFRNIFDFLYMPREHMLPGMSANVIMPDGIRSYVLLITGDPADMPWPLKDLPRGAAGSFRNYWELLGVARPDGTAASEKQYAPLFQDGIPPYYEGFVEGAADEEGYVFPAGIEWDEERNFTATQWSAQRKDGDMYFRYREPAVILQDPETGKTRTIRKWSRPMKIGDFPGKVRMQNRFVRCFTEPACPTTTYKGRTNTFALYEMFGVEYGYSDIQPKRRVWADLRAEEKAAYEAEYGAVVDTADPVLIQRINRLWMVTAEKDDFNNLLSAWEGPTEIMDGDGTKVRYSVDNSTDINEIRNNGGDTTPQLYEDGGWNAEYNSLTHRFMAYRVATTDPWIVLQTAGEAGDFIKNVFKQYPINYYDRIHNPNTRMDYRPVGKLHDNNYPADDIPDPWLDTPPVADLKPGYEIYMCTRLESNGGKNISDWSPAELWSSRVPVADRIEASATVFLKKEDATQNGDKVEARSPDSILLKGYLVQNGINLHTKTGAEGYDTTKKDAEVIHYKWYLTYNGGEAFGPTDANGNPVLDDDSRPLGILLYDSEDPLNAAAETNRTTHKVTVELSGRAIRILPETVNSMASFKCVQERDVQGNKDFQGVGMAQIPYISHISISDVVDKTLRGISVVPDTNQFVTRPIPGNLFVKEDFLNARRINLVAHVQQIDLASASWWKWDFTQGDYNQVMEDTLAGVDGAAEWKKIVEGTSVTAYWLSLNDNDLRYTVAWDQHGFNDKTKPAYNVFKFQALTELNQIVQDTVLIGRVGEGANARDILMAPEHFVVNYTSDETAFYPGAATGKTFAVTAQNVASPTFTWRLRDKSDAVIHTAAGGSYKFEADHTITTSQFYGKTFDEVKAGFPYYLEVECDQWPGLKDDVMIGKLAGGNLGIKGEEGNPGVSVIWDRTDIIPTDANGTPLSAVSENMTVLVFEGKQPAKGGTLVGEYQIEVNSVTAGTTYTIENGLTFKVTGVDAAAAEIVFDFSLKKNTGVTGTDSEEGYVIDDTGTKVHFFYKLKKTRAGANAYTFHMENPTQLVTLTPESKVASAVQTLSTTWGSIKVQSRSFASLYQGGGLVALNANQLLVTLNGIAPAKIGEHDGFDVYKAKSTDTVTATQKKLYIFLGRTSTEIKMGFLESDTITDPTIPAVFSLNNPSWPAHKQQVTLSSVKMPVGVVSLVLIPKNGNAIPFADKGTVDSSKNKEIEVLAYRDGVSAPQWLTDNAASIKWYLGTTSSEVTGSGNTYISSDRKKLYVHPDDVSVSTAVFAQINGQWAQVSLYDLKDARKRWVLYAGYKATAPETVAAPAKILGSYNGLTINYQEEAAASGYKLTGTSYYGVGLTDTYGYYFRRDGKYFNGATELSYTRWVTDDVSKLDTSFGKTVWFMCEGREVSDGKVEWMPWFQVKGEKGKPGDTLTNYFMFKKVTGNSDGTVTPPAITNTNTIPQMEADGWSASTPVTGVNEYVFETFRLHKAVDPAGSLVDKNNLTPVTGSVWIDPRRLTGIRGGKGNNGSDARIIFKSASSKPAVDAMSTTPAGWSYDPVAPTAGNPVWSATGQIRDGAMVSPGWQVHPAPWERHIDDVKGEQGEGIKTHLAVSTVKNADGVWEHGWAKIARVYRAGQYHNASFTLAFTGRSNNKFATLYFEAERDATDVKVREFTLSTLTGDFSASLRYVSVGTDYVDIWIKSDSTWNYIYYSIINERPNSGITFYSDNYAFTTTAPSGTVMPKIIGHGMNWRGAFGMGRYDKNDVVISGDSLYICLKDNITGYTSSPTAAGTTDWEKLALATFSNGIRSYGFLPGNGGGANMGNYNQGQIMDLGASSTARKLRIRAWVSTKIGSGRTSLKLTRSTSSTGTDYTQGTELATRTYHSNSAGYVEQYQIEHYVETTDRYIKFTFSDHSSSNNLYYDYGLDVITLE